jgi:hypothetical protein
MFITASFKTNLMVLIASFTFWWPLGNVAAENDFHKFSIWAVYICIRDFVQKELGLDTQECITPLKTV